MSRVAEWNEIGWRYGGSSIPPDRTPDMVFLGERGFFHVVVYNYTEHELQDVWINDDNSPLNLLLDCGEHFGEFITWGDGQNLYLAFKEERGALLAKMVMC